MKNLTIIATLSAILLISACTSGKINYRINDQGRMVVEKTVDGEFAIRGNASDASSEAIEFEKNMTIKVMYSKYLNLLEKGDFENAKKLRIEIEVLKGKITSTPDTPINVSSVSKNEEISVIPLDAPGYWKKRKEEIKKAKAQNKKPPRSARRFNNN